VPLASSQELQARLITAESPKTLVLGLFSAWLIAAAMWDGTRTTDYALRAAAWAACTSLLLLRGISIARASRTAGPEQLQGIGRRLYLNGVALAFMWGLSSLVFLPGSDLQRQVLLIVAIALLIVGGCIGRAAHVPEVRLCALVTSAVFAFGLVRMPDPFLFFIGLGYLLFGPVVALFAGAQENMVRRERELNIQIDALLQQAQRARDQAVQAREQAERANAAKTRFLASASHDLRQPMHAIGLLVGMLRERVADADSRRMADRTHQAVQAMERMFSGLLDVSKLDAGAVQPQPRRFAAQELLQRLHDAYAPLAAAKGLRLRVRPSPLWLHTDPLLLERIAGNFLTNALRYTRTGGALVACRRRGAVVRLVVFDTGIGIPAPQREVIFEEFVRLGEEGGDERGLGLGLSIVQRTAALLGLPVSVTSQSGRGSAFAVDVPSAPAQALPQPRAASATGRLAGAFVLVVDNDSRNREATAEALRRAGCLVLEAGSASAALAEVVQHLRPVDLVVCDLRLGEGLDGLGLIGQLSEAAGSALPALLVTAEVQVPDVTGERIAVLRKPVSLQALTEAADRALAGGG